MKNSSTPETISVAIACYNGERFIKQQLQSILNQTKPVDEIIISDDGSSDQTLKIARDLNDDRIHIFRNNGRRGVCGNFENAISLCKGDVIFIADQDDVWDLNRVERTLGFFHNHTKADLVICNARSIDKNGSIISNSRLLSEMPVESGKLPKEEYLEKSVSGPLAHGMLMCITKRLLRKAMPFPESNGFHDQWIMFCALCEDSCYYLNEQLVSYRKHGNNATGKSKYAGNLFQQLKAILRMFMHTTKSTDRVVLGEKMMNHLKEYGSDVTSAYETAKEVYEIGLREMDAFTDSRIRGAFKLTRLYCSNMRYRRSGTKVVILKLFAILFKN